MARLARAREGVVLLLLCISLGWNAVTLHKVKGDERTFISNGIPASTCLLEVFRNVEPLLARAQSAQRPLHAFLLLQGNRYAGHRCPDQDGEATRLAAKQPKVK